MLNRIPGQKLTSLHEQINHSELHKGFTEGTRRTKIPTPVGASKGQNGIFLSRRIMKRKKKFFCVANGIVVKSTFLFLFLAFFYGVVQRINLRLRHMTPIRNDKKQASMSPFNSHPPKFIALNVTGNIRHACLQEIRNSRHSFYLSYIKDAHHILLVDPAYHSNVGDHMITIAELTLLQSLSTTTTTLSQCSYVQAHDFVPSCDVILQQEVNYPDQIVQTYTLSSSSSSSSSSTNKRNMSALYQNKIALWHGGGNFGNLWSTAQQARIQSIVRLLQANYTIIGMPNSWFYTNEQIESNDIRKLRYNIILGLGLDATNVDTITDVQLSNAVSSRIVWTWREHYSYERALKSLPYCTHQLVPDIAFQLGPYLSVRSISTSDSVVSRQQHLPDAMNGFGMMDIVFLLRNDHESMFASVRNRHSIQSLFNSIPGASELSFSIVDWDDRLQRFQPKNPNDVYFTETAIQLLSMGNILICDRLHAAILAYISDLSFIYLDQISGKICKTFTVAMESGPNCQRSGMMSNIQNSKPISQIDDKQTFWSHAETLAGAVETAVQILQQQKSIETTGRHQRSITREQRRNQIRQKLINA